MAHILHKVYSWHRSKLCELQVNIALGPLSVGGIFSSSAQLALLSILYCAVTFSIIPFVRIQLMCLIWSQSGNSAYLSSVTFLSGKGVGKIPQAMKMKAVSGKPQLQGLDTLCSMHVPVGHEESFLMKTEVSAGLWWPI
jgi:hypothetical protein